MANRDTLDIGTWRQLFEGSDSAPLDPHAARQGLRLLLLLRVFAPCAQAITLLLVTRYMQVSVPIGTASALIALEAVVALATWVRLKVRPEVSETELFVQALADVALYLGMLYLTGGTTNPFAPMLVLPMVIVSAALRPGLVWAVAIATMVSYAVLRNYQTPLDHPKGYTQVSQLIENGMVVNYMFTAAFLAFLSTRMHAALRRRERHLADARDRQMRDDSATAIGSLAADYAHELSSPLATMAVVVSELKRRSAGMPEVVQDLALVETQVSRCKHLVSQMAEAGGRRRADTAGPMTFDAFVRRVADNARALNTGTTVEVEVVGPAPAPTIVAEETLRQTIMNLVQNALRASPCHVTIRAGWTAEELRVDVLDSGPGFAPSLLVRIGNRVDSARKLPGAGMGLLLSAASLERLGGHIEVANRVEGGARATVHLPLNSILIPTPSKQAVPHASH